MDQTSDRKEWFDSILEEVTAANVDQLVMVSRADASSIYMLSKGRVKRGISFERDITTAFVDYFGDKDFSSLQFRVSLTSSTQSGKCYSIKITRKDSIQ